MYFHLRQEQPPNEERQQNTQFYGLHGYKPK